MYKKRDSSIVETECVLPYIVIVFMILCGCADKPQNENTSVKENESTQKGDGVAPAASQISLSNKNLMFRYLDEDKIVVATSIDEIPEAFRKVVFIDDLTASPTERKSTNYLQEFDLSNVEPGALLTGRPVLRKEIEQRIAAKRPQPIKAKTAVDTNPPEMKSNAKVVLYSTSWCGYCRKARNFLTKNQIKFTEKDIEKSPAAKKEMNAKALRAGVRIGGVPVLEVNGQIISGFSEERIIAALKNR